MPWGGGDYFVFEGTPRGKIVRTVPDLKGASRLVQRYGQGKVPEKASSPIGKVGTVQQIGRKRNKRQNSPEKDMELDWLYIVQKDRGRESNSPASKNSQNGRKKGSGADDIIEGLAPAAIGWKSPQRGIAFQSQEKGKRPPEGKTEASWGKRSFRRGSHRGR